MYRASYSQSLRMSMSLVQKKPQLNKQKLHFELLLFELYVVHTEETNGLPKKMPKTA